MIKSINQLTLLGLKKFNQNELFYSMIQKNSMKYKERSNQFHLYISDRPGCVVVVVKRCWMRADNFWQE